MRRINIVYAKPGMTLAYPVLNMSGGVRIPAGTTLDENTIAKLFDAGVVEIYIDDPRARDIDAGEPISPETRQEAIAVLRKFSEQVAEAVRPENIKIPYDELWQVVDNIIDELIRSSTDIATLLHPGAPEFAPYMLALNRTILSVIVANRSGLQRRAHDIALGALLCDIGLARVPQEIARKAPDSLTREEQGIIRRHPMDGLKILRMENRFTAYTRAIVYQHHERNDGSGYPRGIKGAEIDPLARIVSVADAYCTLVYPPYPDWPRLKPQDALEFMMGAAGFEFDHPTVLGVLHYIAAYPVGTMVRLNTGEKGIVVKNRKGLSTRPVVRVLYDAEGNEIAEPYEIDLAEGRNQTKLVVETCEG